MSTQNIFHFGGEIRKNTNTFLLKKVPDYMWPDLKLYVFIYLQYLRTGCQQTEKLRLSGLITGSHFSIPYISFVLYIYYFQKKLLKLGLTKDDVIKICFFHFLL